MNITIKSDYGDITMIDIDLGDNFVVISNSDNDDRLDNSFSTKDLVPHLESFKELVKVIENYRNKNMHEGGSKQ